jgi:hypothetical protein
MSQKFKSQIDAEQGIKISNELYDGSAAAGSSGQVLSSTGSETQWIDLVAESTKRIEVTVKNVSGASLAKGVVVHAAPTADPPEGNVIEVIAADANDAAKMPAIGVLNETIADEAEGEAVMFGAVSGIDTSGFSIGDELYVSETAGEFTATKPTAFTSQVQKIAVVIKSHASNGLIKVFGAGRANDVPNRVDRNMNFTDNSELTFGDSDDASIKYDSTASQLFIGGDSKFLNDATFSADVTLSDGVLTVNDGNNYVKLSQGANSISEIELKDQTPVYLQGWGDSFRVAVNGDYTNRAFEIASDKSATFTGSLTVNGNITTDGIFINESAPDDEVVQFIQNSRKTSLKTYFSTGATGSHLDFRISDGSDTGSFNTPLVLYPNRAIITTAEITTIKTNNIEKATTGSPILINSGLDTSNALRVYYDMQVYNTISLTDSSWVNQGRISANNSGVLSIQGGSGTDTIFINSTDQVKIRNNADLGTYTRLGIAMDVGGNAANLDEATDYNAMSIAPYRSDSNYGMYFGGGHGTNSSAGFIQSAKVDGTDSSTISLNPFGGAVGINTGTSDPLSTLHVVGSFRTDLESTYNMGILNEYVSQYVTRTKFGNLASSSNLEIYYDISGTEEARITRNYTVAPLKFMRGNVTDMEITGTGNVLIPGYAKYIKLGGYSYIGESLEELHSLTIASDSTESIRFSHYNRTTSAYELNMIIDQNSRVGIGNATPMARLTIGSSQGSSLDFSYDATNGYRNNISNYWDSSTDTRMDFNIGRTVNVAPVTVMSVGYNSNVGINTQTPAADLHVTTNGTSSSNGIVKIGGSVSSLGLVLEYDQAAATFSYITANPTYTSDTSIMKIRVDGDTNPDQLFLKGNGSVGINCDAGNVQLKVIQTRTSEWTGGFVNYTSSAYGLYVDTSGATGTAFNFACYTTTGDGMALNGAGRLHIGNKTSFPSKLTVTSESSALKAVEASKPYAASQNIASFTNGNAFVRNTYDTFTIAQTDVPCLVITETVNASNQGTEQRLTLTVGDNKCVIGTSSTVTDGMYFNVARGTDAVGYNASLGITALRLTNNGDATFYANAIVPNSIYVADYIYHLGDTNTYLRFTEDTFTFRTGGNDRAILNNNALNVGPLGTTSSTVNDGPLRVCNNSNGNNDMGRGSNAIQLGPKTTRNATANYYYGGITWNGLLNYGNGTTYDIAPHVWVGAKYKDFPGSERSSFVVGVKSGDGVTGSGNNIPVERLTVDFNGTLTATGDIIAYSDVRVKENINTVKNALDTVTKLRGVTYTRKDIDDKSTKVGVIAQEVLDVIPEVVQLDDNDRYSVAYGNMAGIFIEAIKELKAEVDSLKEQLKSR